MNFTILDSTRQSDISKSASRLNEQELNILLDKAEPILGRLTVDRFVFLMANLASRGTNFNKNLELIEKYFHTTPHLEMRLVAEDLLHKLFLKKYETEDAYNKYYSLMQVFYHRKLYQEKTNPVASRHIVFFVHNPVFLAHTNHLFNLVRKKNGEDYQVTICSLRYDAKFAAKVEQVNANFKVFSDPNLETAYGQLINFSKEALALVWVSVPVHLAYVSQFLKNTVLWTHKFHPNFINVMGAVGADSLARNKFSFFGKEWLHFYGGMEVLNQGHSPKLLSERRLKFGSICREELIDNAAHWKNVHTILQHDPKLRYIYCGKQPIHQRWCEHFCIPDERVEFMGWLAAPEEKVRECLFLLDGPKLGHGVISMEAIACGIPILSPQRSTGHYQSMLNWVQQKISSEDHLKIAKTVFKNESELRKIVGIFSDEKQIENFAKLLKHFYELIDEREQTFDEYIAILQKLSRQNRQY